jgi:hypothetical protein
MASTPIPDDVAPDVAVALDLIDLADIADWPRLTAGLSHSQPYVRDADSERLDGIQAWLATRAADERSFVQAAVANFARVLDDLLLVLHYDLDPRPGAYWVRKWYHRGLGGTGSPLEVEFFEIHILLIQNLTAELTRAINLVLVRARQADARVLAGVGLATVDTGSSHAPMQAAQYSEQEQTAPQPYPGLLGFPGVIMSRDIGALGEKAEGVPRTVDDYAGWLNELFQRRLAKPSDPPPKARPPFSLPGPRDRDGQLAGQRSHGSAPADATAGFRPLRAVMRWFGRENPTVADQILVTVVGGLILAGIVLLISTLTAGSHASSVSKRRGLPGSPSTSSTSARAFPGQIEGGNSNLGFADLTRRAQFANPQHAKPCDVLEYRVLIYNPGPGNLSNVRIAAYINTITPYRKIEPTVVVYTPNGANDMVAFQGTIDLPTAETEAYVARSTQMVNSAGSMHRGEQCQEPTRRRHHR